MKHRESVRLELSDGFADGMAEVRMAFAPLHHRWLLQDATWEPHDWSDFD